MVYIDLNEAVWYHKDAFHSILYSILNCCRIRSMWEAEWPWDKQTPRKENVTGPTPVAPKETSFMHFNRANVHQGSLSFVCVAQMRLLLLQDQRSVQRESKSVSAMQPVNIFSWAQTCCGSLPVCLGMCREALQCCTVRERQGEEFWQAPSSFPATVLLCEEKHLEEIKDCILCVYVCVWVCVCVLQQRIMEHEKVNVNVGGTLNHFSWHMHTARQCTGTYFLFQTSLWK